jgi:16S rRNA G966 N2-methylase RsmD
MRVIAGSLGGRPFESPHGHRTHPMSEKVRGAIFGILGDIEGLTVLDIFAGSGATRHQDQLFDLVIADPPYDIIPWRDMKILQRHVNDTGFLILSWPGKADWPAFPGLEMVQNRNYGDIQLVFYQKVK